MKPIQLIGMILCMLLFQQAVAQTDADAFREIAPFLPKGYSILHYAIGDANKDGRKDIAAILRNKKEDSLRGLKTRPLISRPVLLLFRNKKNQLYLFHRYDSLLVINDPLIPIPLDGSTIGLTAGRISITRIGGIHLSATVTTSYKWDSLQRNFYLNHYSHVIHQPHGDITIPRNQLTIPEEEMTDAFRMDENYSRTLLKQYCDSKYQIAKDKVFFYTYPGAGKNTNQTTVQAPKEAVIRCYTELKNYIWCTIEVSYGYTVTGFIKRSDISLHTPH